MDKRSMVLKTKTTTSVKDVNNLIRDGWNLWKATPRDNVVIYLLPKDVETKSAEN